MLQQRQYLKNRKLSAERISRLEALRDWTWDPNEDAWERSFAALTAYIEREGDARMPGSHVESGVKLLSWIQTQHRFYKENRLKADRIARLEALPGWKWTARGPQRFE